MRSTPPPDLASAVYVGTIRHARRVEPLHAFRHEVWMLLLDLDEAPALARRTALLGRDRARPLEFRTGDHFRGPRTEGLRARVDRVLRGAGLPPAGGPVRVLTMPRVLGQGFNPVSFWWCHDAGGDLIACIAEVNNTFGDRHPYVLPARAARPTPHGLRWRVRKRMHVSPFHDMEGAYDFEVGTPGDRLRIGARLERAGQAPLEAALEATRRPLTDGSLLRALWRRPGMPWIVWTSIHAHALRLWRRGARYHRRPPYDPAAAGPELD